MSRGTWLFIVLVVAIGCVFMPCGYTVEAEPIFLPLKINVEFTAQPEKRAKWDGAQWVLEPGPCKGNVVIEIELSGKQIVKVQTDLVRSRKVGQITVFDCTNSEAFYEIGSPDGSIAENPGPAEPGSIAPLLSEPDSPTTGLDLKDALSSLTDQDPVVRSRVARALGHLGNWEAATPLCEALSDTNAEVRAASASALGNLGDPATRDKLLSAAEHESNEWAKTAMAWAIWKTDIVRHIGNLLLLLKSGDTTSRANSANRLGFILHPKVVPVLRDALKDPDEDVRQAAARALARQPQ